MMNSQRGPGRTWLIISAVWCCVVVTFFNPIGLIRSRPVVINFFGHTVEYSSTYPKTKLRAALVRFLVRQRTEHPEAQWIKPPEDIEAKVDEIMQAYRPPPLPWRPLFIMAAAALLPAGAILLFGAALGRRRVRST